MQMLKSISFTCHIIGLLLVIFSLVPSVVAEEKENIPIRVLILSGQNNHDWQSTTPVLKKICEDTGRFKVDVIKQPETCTGKMLAPYDVIISNYNTFPENSRVKTWPTEMQDAFLSFVSEGKGLVSVHAGSSSFYDWPEYQQLTCGSWCSGVTWHGPIQKFPVRIEDNKHPITMKMSNFITTDELWYQVPIQPGVKVLASAYSKKTGNMEPIAMVRNWGKGRSYTLLLGHDAKAMNNTAFKSLLIRGTEWAAAKKVTIPVSEDWPKLTKDEERAIRDVDLVLTPLQSPREWKKTEKTNSFRDYLEWKLL